MLCYVMLCYVTKKIKLIQTARGNNNSNNNKHRRDKKKKKKSKQTDEQKDKYNLVCIYQPFFGTFSVLFYRFCQI